MSSKVSPTQRGSGQRFLSLCALLILIAYPQRSSSFDLFRYQRVAMGTIVEIALMGEDDELLRKSAMRAFQEIGKIERLMSPRVESSEIFRINRSAGEMWVKVSPETLEVIKTAQEFSELSGGAFDVSVGPIARLWSSARERRIPLSHEEIKRSLRLVNFRDVLLHPTKGVFLRKKGMSIDLGGIAKGYAIDRASDLLRHLGHENFIVNAGGDLRAGGLKFGQPWSIGIRDPRISRTLFTKVWISDAAVATSGDYEKFFIHQGKRYHHIINPKNGFPAEGCQSVTIITQEAMKADALATAVFVLGLESGYSLSQKLEDVDCVIVGQGGKTRVSPSLKNPISFHP